MFHRASTGTAGVEVIFIILLGCLFLCQTLGKLVMWLIGRFRYTAFNGKEIIQLLAKKNHMEDAKIKTKKFNFASSFYSYKKRKNEFTISNSFAKQDSLIANIFGLQSVAYANEQNNRSLQSRWQLIGVGLLSLVPYIMFIGSMLLIYLPAGGIKGEVKYYLPVEVLCIVGWVLILITLFWWMSITQNLELNVEDLAKQLDNKNLLANLNGWMRYASYIPFSYRTIL